MFKKLIHVLTIAYLTAIFTGCANNGFSKYYTPSSNKKFSPTKNVSLITYSDFSEVKQKISTGYESIGVSGFTDTKNATYQEAIFQAKHVGSDIVMFSSKYLNTGKLFLL